MARKTIAQQERENQYDKGIPTLLRMSESLRKEIDEFGRRNGIPSRTAVIRFACRKLLDAEQSA